MSTSITSFKDKYRWLSNFWPAQIEFEGMKYPSVEHAYVASKTLDLEKRKQIIALTAGEAKKFGRKMEVRTDWTDELRLQIMESLLRQKFSKTNIDLMILLIQTYPLKLVEGNNWHDNFFGSCTCKKETCCNTGKNNLGKLLEKIRDEIIVEDKESVK